MKSVLKALSIAAAWCVVASLVAGCPRTRGAVPTALEVRGPGVRISTDSTDPEVLDHLVALVLYLPALHQELGMGAAGPEQPLEGWLLVDESLWQERANALAGSQSAAARALHSGAFSVGDRSLVRCMGRDASLRLVAHESVHQAVSRRFASPPPRFLEEGLGCLAEGLYWEKGEVRWLPTRNEVRRAGVLQRLSRGKGLDAARLIGGEAPVPGAEPEVSEYYARAWAAAAYCWAGEGGRLRPGLLRWIADCRSGRTVPKGEEFSTYFGLTTLQFARQADQYSQQLCREPWPQVTAH